MTEQFIQERRCLLGVSPRTVIWYQCSFKAFEGAMTCKEALCRSGPGAEPSLSHRWNRRERTERTEPQPKAHNPTRGRALESHNAALSRRLRKLSR